MSENRKLHIVLVEPEIPQNTGNIGRTCVGLNAALHLVGELGFSLAEKDLKRAGLDYWPKLDLRHHATWEDFLAQVERGAQLHFFSTHGGTFLWDRLFELPCYLIFGSESRGFPPSFYEKYKKDLVRIPTTSDIRSLNVATAAGIAAFEAVRQLNLSHRL